MTDDFDKSQTLKWISEKLADAEDAINAHPAKTRGTYKECVAAFFEGSAGSTDSEWSRELGLSISDLRLIHNYLLATSFMAAWYDLAGDKAHRDQAAQTASIIVAGLGVDPEKAFEQCVMYEQTWKATMQSRGVKLGKAGCAATAAGFVNPPPNESRGLAFFIFLPIGLGIAYGVHESNIMLALPWWGEGLVFSGIFGIAHTLVKSYLFAGFMHNTGGRGNYLLFIVLASASTAAYVFVPAGLIILGKALFG